MEKLVEWSFRNITRVSIDFQRYLAINWSSRLIILVGSRGVGKTTMMLQQLKKLPVNERLYASLDNLYFSNHTIIDLVEEFSQMGGKYLYLDEIQKYKNWSVEVKNIYDNFPDIKMVLSGSSTTEILKSEGDLSRRALYYKLNGLSFREFLNFSLNLDLPSYSLQEILGNHQQIAFEISQKIKPIKEFATYSRYGYYPFFKEDEETYHHRLRQIINTVIEVDIPAVYSIDYTAVQNIKKLLAVISELVPFKPNVKKLSEQIGISRETFTKYMKYLEKADILQLLYSNTKGVSLLNKPEKIYINNSNISYALTKEVNSGNVREAFFINQLKNEHQVGFSGKGDFLVDEKYLFEIGGKDKKTKQIKGENNAWVVADNIEISVGNKIPLWLFGFVY